MTLCIVWRTQENVCFASDSRLTFGRVACDAAIKIHRLPYCIFGPRDPDGKADVLAAGDLGFTFSGSSSVALLAKDAIAEVVRDLVGIPGHHDFGMDGLSDVIFRGFKVVADAIAPALFEKVATCVLFAAFCERTKQFRTFRMEVSPRKDFSMHEVLRTPGDFEIIGNGSIAAREALPHNPQLRDFLLVLRKTIDDVEVEGVGGPVQFGQFRAKLFQPFGTMRLGDSASDIHYWRGPLDLNSVDFDQATGLVPRLPYLDLMQEQ